MLTLRAPTPAASARAARRGAAPAGQQRPQRPRLPRGACRAAGGGDEAPQQPPAAAPQGDDAAQPRGGGAGAGGGGGFPYGAMAVLAGAGAAETLYLTGTKLLHASAACPTSGCDSVLNSAYGELFGLPLPLFGAAAYAGVGLTAAAAWRASAAGRPVPAPLAGALAGGVGVLGASSAFLMYVLATRLSGAPCVWCYASAALSGGLVALLVAGMDRRAMADAAGPGLGATAAALAVLAAGFGPALGGVDAAELELPYVSPAVTTASSEQALRLAARLRAAGAKMYGAFWCSHCYDQKQVFGAAAMADFPYVECFPAGWKKGVAIDAACEAASVKAFPTWVINGTSTEGQLELEQLEQMLDAPPAQAAAEGAAAAAAE
ncbi:LTO1 [Scenedesmus sp. PABB004]|nr:LTO1 [Scenedesmus sp. PABB004]